MRFSVSIFLILLLAAGCSKSDNSPDATAPQTQARPAPSGDYPKLVIDDPHQMKDSNMPPAYQIVATAGIRLDASQFHFMYGSNAITPNMVMVLGIGSGSGYRLSQATETNIYVIDATTLQPLKGGTFQGFRPGDHLMIAIGRLVRGSDKDDFWNSWIGRVDVK